MRSALESRLHAHAKKPIEVFLRTSAEMRAVLAAKPFTQPEPKFVYAFFLNDKPPADAATTAKHRAEEEIHLGKRELYVILPTGNGPVEVGHSGGSARDSPKHEYGRQAGGDEFIG